jgi:hypothetical protein
MLTCVAGLLSTFTFFKGSVGLRIGEYARNYWSDATPMYHLAN